MYERYTLFLKIGQKTEWYDLKNTQIAVVRFVLVLAFGTLFPYCSSIYLFYTFESKKPQNHVFEKSRFHSRNTQNTKYNWPKNTILMFCPVVDEEMTLRWDVKTKLLKIQEDHRVKHFACERKKKYLGTGTWDARLWRSEADGSRNFEDILKFSKKKLKSNLINIAVLYLHVVKNLKLIFFILG